jgi:hypothetical protein
MKRICLLLLGLAFGLCLDAAAAPSVATPRLYGVLQTTLEHAGAGRDIGLRVALVSVSWDRFEPKPGSINQAYVAEVLAKKQALRKLGYKLQIDLGVQYAPEWVSELPNGRYQNQFADRFRTKQSGESVPNVVFNSEVRRHMAAYFGEVFARLGVDWDYVRLGCSQYGELNYPHAKFGDHVNCYWAFDDLAQGKAPGLPEGMSPCPVPGWIPGAPSPRHQSARQFIEWYLDGLRNYQDWQIATVRHWYPGEICMLYGSWGQRPGGLEAAINGDLGGGTSQERNGEIQQGFDWPRMIGSIQDPLVIVYCTWMDGTLNNRDICDDNSADPARWSPVHWQASLARANPLHLRVWGENTGRNNRAAMQLTFDRIKRFDLMGVMWAFEGELFVNPNPAGYATFSDYAAFIGNAQ